MITPNDPAPWFTARSSVNPLFHLDAVGGRYLVLCFFGSGSRDACQRVLKDFEQNQGRFDPDNTVFLGICTDPDDERLGRVPQNCPGLVYVWDFDLAVSRLYGAASPDGSQYLPHTVVLDPALRAVAAIPFGPDHETHVAQVLQVLDGLPPLASLNSFAPVIAIPGVFERDFCRMLIDLYDRQGGEESGFMREVGGKTVAVTDYSHKRRSDCSITDQEVVRAAQARLHRRVIPEIMKAFQFNATRIERHIVACYDASTGGHFRPHRDNTTRGTAHRRFAVTINLNAEEFEGGELRFPEFGTRTYKATTGGAIVFSCSLLHEATPVVKGKRYAFLPFLYDDEAAKIRQMNLKFVGRESGTPPQA